jgi:hypothetical protein
MATMPRRPGITGKSRRAAVHPARARARVASSLVPADISRILAGGGRARIAFLRYCVLSMAMEPLFLFLAGEYRLRPSHAAAMALYDVFCSPQAAAKVRGVPGLLPPRDLKLAAAIQSIRAQEERRRLPDRQRPDTRVVHTAPYRQLFEPIADALQADPSGHVQRVGQHYNPALEPEENLPGGRMSAVQRNFVENVWRPVVRPHLVFAGFWQISTIG